MNKTVLDNGLTIITEENKNSKICTLAYVIKSGSYDEEENERGIAHLIEHMMFKGTTHRDYKNINKQIESVGGYLNAETSFNYTKYHCTIPCQEWKIGMDVLSDMMFNHTIPEEELVKEKKVVQEELTMYNDDPQSFISNKIIENMFKKYPNRQSIGGTTQSVGKLTRDDLISFIDRNYFLENMIVIANGNINHSEIVDFVKNYIDKLNINFTSYQKQYDKFEKYPLEGKIIKYNRQDVEQTQLAFGLFGPGYNDKDAFPLELLTIILGGNSSSILYNIIREQKGLAYSISMYTEFLEDVCMITGYAGLNKENDVIEEILEQFNLLKDNVNEELLEDAKLYYIGMLYLQLEKTSGTNSFLTEQLINNNYDSIETIINQVKSVKLEDVQEVIDKYFVKENICFAKLN
jgi:predicted Zn-dependent peptidase